MQFRSPRFASPALLATLILTLPFQAGCSSSSSSANPGTGILPEAAIAPLSEYTPFGPMGSIRVPFWKKHVKDSGADFEFIIDLDAPVGAGGATLAYDLNGTATPQLHYSLLSPNPLVLVAGDTQARILIDLIPSGQFFLERSLKLELGRSGLCWWLGRRAPKGWWIRIHRHCFPCSRRST